MNAIYPPERCACGADDCVRCRGAQVVRDYDMDGALDHVVETILNFGQYPQPRRVGTFITTGRNKPKEFDLYDFLEDQDKGIEFADLLEYFIASMGDHSTCGRFADLRSKWDKQLEKMLREHLTDSDLVQKVAEAEA